MTNELKNYRLLGFCSRGLVGGKAGFQSETAEIINCLWQREWAVGNAFCCMGASQF